MTFAAMPLLGVLGLAALAAVAVVVLYLLRRTPKPQLVSNIQFWLRAAQSSRPKLLSSLRIPLLALLLSLLAALLMVVLAGDPRFGDGVRGTTVIVIAAGSTMGAHDESGERRIDRAADETRRWVESTTIAGDVAVVRAGLRPSVLLPLTDRAADVERALSGLEPDDGPSDLSSALALADAILAEHGALPEGAAPTGQILLVTDSAIEPATRAPTILLPVGTPADTIAITAFSARRVPTAVGEYAAFIEVANFSSRDASLRVEVMDGEVPILDERIVLSGHERRSLSAGGFSSRRAELVAHLEAVSIAGSSDALSADDTAHSVVEALERTRVLLVTEGDAYLEAALSMHPGLAVDTENHASLAAETSASLAEYAAIVLHHTNLPEGVVHASVLAFDPPEGGPVALGRVLTRPAITAMLGSHPVFEGVRLDGTHVTRAHAIEERTGDQVLLRSRDRAIAIAREAGRRRLVAFAFDTEDTDLVRGEAFPLVVHNALRWVADHGEPTPLSRRIGGALVAEAGTPITTPTGDEVTGGIVPTVTHAGLWSVGTRTVAFGATEHARALGAGATGGTFAAASTLPPLAVLVALALLCVMLLEWALLHRGKLE